ncbi:MAG: type II toxin-antitoxin system HicA family toxin [Chloroflexi bacterium]|nr:type II toxin-antitoxin system HicA family toxin [Chloroflexota bacterium]
MKVRDIIATLEADGWYVARTKGSHRQYKHSVKPGPVTVPGNPGKDIAAGSLQSIFKQAQIRGHKQ